MDIEKKTKRLTNFFIILYAILVASSIIYLIWSFIHINAATTEPIKQNWTVNKLSDQQKLSLVIKSIIIISISLPFLIIMKIKKKQTKRIIKRYLKKIQEQKEFLLNIDDNYDLNKKIKKYKKLKSLIMELNRICGEEIMTINNYIGEEIEKTTIQIETNINKKIACDEISSKSSNYSSVLSKIEYLIENYKLLFNATEINNIYQKQNKNDENNTEQENKIKNLIKRKIEK